MWRTEPTRVENLGDELWAGDIGHTKLINNAGLFVDFEEAVKAGIEEIGNQYEFVVFGFLKD